NGDAGRVTRRLVSVALAGLCIAGCKRQQQGDGGSNNATTRRTSSAPATRAPAMPKDITLTIDGSPVAFPPVRLSAADTGAGVAVRLTTPTSDEQAGNSLYFDLTLPDADDATHLGGAAWHFH